MAYVSLYRKYRPQTFAEVVGQDHVTTTLSNALTENRLHHAYLFTGPRGTGKTSAARILAKALNCERGPTATPCNVCPSCVGITAGNNVDVIEIDAASHGGVDDVRDLRDRVAFAPAAARMKVYIVDECHMLSTAGWNAFLKTVEEPPGHVLFVFATTEPHKVLDTILSRTQRFDFKRVGSPALGGLVADVAEREGLELEPGVVDLVVRAGDGSARDTLSVLDQIMAFTGLKVTLQGVVDVLGAVPDELLIETADLIAAGDVAGLLVLVQRLGDAGRDLRQFARDAVEHLRSLLLLQVAPDAGLVETTPDRLARLTAQAGRLGRVELLRAVELLAECQAVMRRGNTRLPLEIALAKAAMPEASGDPAALAARMDRLERRGGVGRPPSPVTPVAEVPASEEVTVPDPAPVRSTTAETAPPTGAGVDIDLVRRSWDAVLAAAKRRSLKLGAMLAAGQPVDLTDSRLTLRFTYPFHAEFCGSDTSRATLGQILDEVLGVPLDIVCVVVDGGAGSPRTDDTAASEADDVAETELAEAAGELPDEAEAHARAIATLTRDLGATVVE